MTRPANVLLVEDDEAIADLYRVRLVKDGYDVAVARDGEEGLHMATSMHPDVIYLDLRLPKLDGLAVLRELRKDPDVAAVPVVILTNYEEAELGSGGRGLGVERILLKSETTPGDLASLTAQLIHT
jgi:DNA-binding response OmpR family regulator